MISNLVNSSITLVALSENEIPGLTEPETHSNSHQAVSNSFQSHILRRLSMRILFFEIREEVLSQFLYLLRSVWSVNRTAAHSTFIILMLRIFILILFRHVGLYWCFLGASHKNIAVRYAMIFVLGFDMR